MLLPCQAPSSDFSLPVLFGVEPGLGHLLLWPLSLWPRSSACTAPLQWLLAPWPSDYCPVAVASVPRPTDCTVPLPWPLAPQP